VEADAAAHLVRQPFQHPENGGEALHDPLELFLGLYAVFHQSHGLFRPYFGEMDPVFLEFALDFVPLPIAVSVFLLPAPGFLSHLG
jgi:hypothetical protein